MSNKHQELLQLAQDKNSDANPSPLLDRGANPNIRDPFYHKWTPLHYAVFLNKENFALQLLQHPKTNASLLDTDGFSPLYWAAKKSTPKIVKALMEHGCDPNERDMHGMTPLFAAVASNETDNVEVLLSSPDIDVNQPNQYGGSALHHTAYATDNVEIADLLVKAGANLFLYDYENRAPLHVAKRRKRKRLFKYFKQKMHELEPDWKPDISAPDSSSDTSLASQQSIDEPQPSSQQIIDTNNDHDDDKEDDIRDEVENNINTPQLGRYNSSHRSSKNSLSPPASITQSAALNTSPLNDPLNVMREFLTSKDNISLPPAVNSNGSALSNHPSNNSVDSNFSRQSSDSSNDNNGLSLEDGNRARSLNFMDRKPSKQRSNPVTIHRNKQMVPNKPTRQMSHSPGPTLSGSYRTSSTSFPPQTRQQARQRHDLWHNEHQQRLKQVQENKLKIALKIEQSHLNKEARDLLQEQQHYFQYEQEVFYASMKHEYDKIHYQLNHYLEVTKQLIRQNHQLKHENNKFKQAFRGHNNGNFILTASKRKSNHMTSKHKREFYKWFKKEIGEDFMEYYDYFANSGFDDLRTIRHINDEQGLIDLGIHKKGHRLYILDKIESYRLQYQQSNQHDIARPAFIDYNSSPINKSIDNDPHPDIHSDEGEGKANFKTE